MQYKGYTAGFEYDDSVGRLHGRVANSGPYLIATFEAADAEMNSSKGLRVGHIPHLSAYAGSSPTEPRVREGQDARFGILTCRRGAR